MHADVRGTRVRRLLLTCALAVVITATAVTPALAGPDEDVLRPGERLEPGQALRAPGGVHTLVVQPDGSLGLYASDDTVRWSSGRGVPGSGLTTDPNGDVRLVAPDGAAVWSTGTGGSDGTLRLRDDGDLVVEAPSGEVVWESGTAQAPATLTGPGRLGEGEVLASPDGRHVLLVDPDAGVQLQGPDGAARWAPETATGGADPAVALELRADGNLVAVDAGGDALWRSRTAGRGGTTLVVQDDGNLVLLDGAGTPVWASNTPIGPDVLPPGGTLGPVGSLGSPSGHLGLALSAGALVATWDGEEFWRSPSRGGTQARLGEDGDLVLLDDAGAPVWSTGTAGEPGTHLVLEEATVLLMAPDGRVLWQVAAPEPPPTPAAQDPRSAQDRRPGAPVPSDCDEVDGPVGEDQVVRTASGIRVHACLAEAIDALVAAARADGVELGGGGWRSPEQQIALRRAHCGPTDADVYDKRASECTPSTARPGTSRHERGLAIDFTQGGRTLGTRSTGYAWLVEHAAAYGLENLPGEPWHWSVDGS